MKENWISQWLTQGSMVLAIIFVFKVVVVKVSYLFCLALISFKRVLKLPSCWSVKIALSFNQVSTSSRPSAQQSVKIVSFNLVSRLSAP